MSYEPKDLSGTLWINDDKAPDNKLPDRTGYIIIQGKKWSLAGWLHKDKNGNAYLSLKATEPRGRQDNSEPTRNPDTEIPGF